MHIVIDVVAALVLLFFLLAGWQKGFLLSALGVLRVILAYGAAFFAGRYGGFWLGEIAHRPRIITIPVVAGLTFVIITFVFHVIMTNMRDEHREKEEEENYSHPWYSSLGGSGINLATGLFSMVILFWLGDICTVGATGHSIPGADQAYFSQLSRRAIYKSVNMATSKPSHETQADSIARMISNPALGMNHLENIIAADSVQQLFSDKQFIEDLLSGDKDRIEQNAALQKLFDDEATINEMKEMGLLSDNEKKSVLSEKLSKIGGNEIIQAKITSLKEKRLLSTKKIIRLIRDPDFDVIIGELMK